MALALVTNYLTGYRLPLYERLHREHGLDVLLYGGGERYVPAWFDDLGAQISAAPFPARRVDSPAAAFKAVAGRGRSPHDAVIAPFAGGAMLPAVYAGARAGRTRFLLWASVWTEPHSPAHAIAAPAVRHIYRHADAIVAYGEHVRSFAARKRGRDSDIIVAPQAVEAEVFGRRVTAPEIQAFRARHALDERPIVLYTGRLVPAKGVDVLLEAWPNVVRATGAQLVLVGEGELSAACRNSPRTVLIGPMRRERLAVPYAAAAALVLPSIRTPRFTEPWGLVVNEAMHQGTAVIASDAVGAAAGGLVLDERTGLVVPQGNADALAGALLRVLTDEPLARKLGDAGRRAVASYTYDAAVAAFGQALDLAGVTRCDPVPARGSRPHHDPRTRPRT